MIKFGKKIQIIPQQGSIQGGKNTLLETLFVTNTNEAGTLSQTPIYPVKVYVGGGGAGALVYIEGVHFTVTGGVINFNPLATGFDVTVGDLVWAEYQYIAP